MGRLLIFFLGGEGEGKSSSRVCVAEKFSKDGGRQTALFLCYILYVEQWWFRCSLQVITKGGSSILGHPGQTCVMFGRQQPVDLVHTLKTVKGLLLLVPPRTPRSSGYDVYAHAVYVVICYMSLTCICLLYVSRPRTRHVICCYMLYVCDMLYAVICCYMLYVCDMLYACYMSSARGGS